MKYKLIKRDMSTANQRVYITVAAELVGGVIVRTTCIGYLGDTSVATVFVPDATIGESHQHGYYTIEKVV